MTAFAVGQARGVVLLAAAERGLPVFEYGPHEVKIAVTGYGRAAKDQVQRMVQVMLGMAVLPRPDDAADALAVAICPAHGQRAACRADLQSRVISARCDCLRRWHRGVDRGRFRRARGRRRRLPHLLRPGHARRPARRARSRALYTHHLVREDLQALYGFRTTEELGFFELLTTVTGVGPEGRAGDRFARARSPTSSWPSSRATRAC